MNRHASIAALALAATGAQAGTLGSFDNHAFYYDDGKEVVLIDTQADPALTRAMVQRLKAATRSPITRVVITHPDAGSFGGLPYLDSLGVRSITSGEVASAMPAGVKPQERFFVRRTLHLSSGETLTLFAVKQAGAADRVVVRIDATGDLIGRAGTVAVAQARLTR